MPDHTPTKACHKCNRVFPATREFFHAGSGKYKLKNECRNCRAGREVKPRDLTPVPVGFKRCTKCGEAKPQTVEFFQWRSDKSIFNPSCRKCGNAAVAANYALTAKSKNSQTRRWQLANPDRVKAASRKYQTNHPEVNRRNGHRRRANQRGVDATFTQTDWQRALDYFSGCCAVCGRPAGLWHKIVEGHWIPLNKGGAYTTENIVPLCHGVGGCNNSQSDRMPDEWLKAKFGNKKAEQVLKRIGEYFTQIGDHNEQ